jgi:hypothetical protein
MPPMQWFPAASTNVAATLEVRRPGLVGSLVGTDDGVIHKACPIASPRAPGTSYELVVLATRTYDVLALRARDGEGSR